MEMAKEGKTRRFWVEDDIFYTVGKRMYVPKWNKLMHVILKECHDSLWAGHSGITRTMAYIEESSFLASYARRYRGICEDFSYFPTRQGRTTSSTTTLGTLAYPRTSLG